MSGLSVKGRLRVFTAKCKGSLFLSGLLLLLAVVLLSVLAGEVLAQRLDGFRTTGVSGPSLGGLRFIPLDVSLWDGRLGEEVEFLEAPVYLDEDGEAVIALDVPVVSGGSTWGQDLTFDEYRHPAMPLALRDDSTRLFFGMSPYAATDIRSGMSVTVELDSIAPGGGPALSAVVGYTSVPNAFEPCGDRGVDLVFQFTSATVLKIDLECLDERVSVTRSVSNVVSLASAGAFMRFSVVGFSGAGIAYVVDQVSSGGYSSSPVSWTVLASGSIQSDFGLGSFSHFVMDGSSVKGDVWTIEQRSSGSVEVAGNTVTMVDGGLYSLTPLVGIEADVSLLSDGGVPVDGIERNRWPWTEPTVSDRYDCRRAGVGEFGPGDVEGLLELSEGCVIEYARQETIDRPNLERLVTSYPYMAPEYPDEGQDGWAAVDALGESIEPGLGEFEGLVPDVEDEPRGLVKVFFEPYLGLGWAGSVMSVVISWVIGVLVMRASSEQIGSVVLMLAIGIFAGMGMVAVATAFAAGAGVLALVVWRAL